MSRTHLAAAALVLASLVFVACAGNPGTPAPDNAEPAPGSRAGPAELAAARAAFDRVYEVLQHPRCVNCHPAGDRPLQYDPGRVHAMNVVRGTDDRGVAGMRCDSCHGTANAPFPNMPPGVASGWRLAPREMVFEGQSRGELAAQLLDPKRSHMNLEQLLEPVPVPHAEFVAAFQSWIDSGAPVPSEGTR